MLIILEHGNAELLFLCLQGNILSADPAFMNNLNRYNANRHLYHIPTETVENVVKLAHAGNWKHRHADHT
jgi:hypothetical protein